MKIFTKLLLLLAGLAAVPLAVIAVLLMVQSNRLGEELVDTSTAAGEESAGQSEKALKEQAEKAYLTIVEEKASQVTGFFNDIRRAVLLESTFAQQCLLVDPPPSVAPPLHRAGDVADWINPTSSLHRSGFQANTHAREPYAVYHIAPGVNEAEIQGTLTRMRPLGYFFMHNQRRLPWCISTYVGHRDGVIFGYPGRAKYSETYDPRKRAWYSHAASAAHLVWTDLYLDRDGTTLVFTCANPVYGKDGKDLLAVSAIDLKLEQVTERLFDLGAITVNDAVLLDGIDDSSKVIVSKRYDLKQTSRDAAQMVRLLKISDFSQEYADIVGDIKEDVPVRRKAIPRFMRFRHKSLTGLILKHGAIYAYAEIPIVEGDLNADPWVEWDELYANQDDGTHVEMPIPEPPKDRPPYSLKRWYYLIKSDIKDITAPVEKIRAVHDNSIQHVRGAIKGGTNDLMYSIAAVSGVVLLLALLAAFLSAGKATHPLRRMTAVARDIGRGNLEQQVAVESSDEIGELGAAINEMIKGLKERDFIKGTFKRYVAAAVVEELLKNPEKLRLGGEKRNLTIFFSDLAGFTTISEGLSPEDLVALINEYLGAMTDAILEQEGTLDKYIGDAILAFWGAPLAAADDPLRACKAALRNLEALRKLWTSWDARGLPHLDMRIGIHTGPVVVGNMGSSTQMNYTVMGDTVNLGSRLEGANKAYGTRIMISETTREACGHAIIVRELDLLAVKGKNKPVRVFELLGLAGSMTDEQLRGYRKFEEGLAAYRAQTWDKAQTAFTESAAILGDKASKAFIERIAHFKLDPPPADWDGAYKSTEK